MAGKELNCIYGICNLIDTPGIFMEEILQETVQLLPSALRYPSMACARILLEGHPYETADYQESKWRLEADIKVKDNVSGIIEVNYRQEPPEDGDLLFRRKKSRCSISRPITWGCHRAETGGGKRIALLATHDALTELIDHSLARDRLVMAISLARRNKTPLR